MTWPSLESEYLASMSIYTTYSETNASSAHGSKSARIEIACSVLDCRTMQALVSNFFRTSICFSWSADLAANVWWIYVIGSFLFAVDWKESCNLVWCFSLHILPWRVGGTNRMSQGRSNINCFSQRDPVVGPENKMKICCKRQWNVTHHNMYKAYRIFLASQSLYLQMLS